jgi:hypothetical protein
MVASQILEVQPGEWLGGISVRTPDEQLIREVGDFMEGIIPEASVLASPNTHAYVADKHMPDGHTEELVVVLSEEQDGEAMIDIGIRSPESNEPLEESVDPDLLEGALKLAMKREGLVVGRLGKNSIEGAAKIAERIGFKLDEESGKYVYEPNLRHVGEFIPQTW